MHCNHHHAHSQNTHSIHIIFFLSTPLYNRNQQQNRIAHSVISRNKNFVCRMFVFAYVQWSGVRTTEWLKWPKKSIIQSTLAEENLENKQPQQQQQQQTKLNAVIYGGHVLLLLLLLGDGRLSEKCTRPNKNDRERNN